MSEEVKRKKTVSFSQFTNWWTCPHRWYRDYILHEKVFEDSIHMSFGTGIHEALQLYLKTLYQIGEKDADTLDLITVFRDVFKREVTKKNIVHTQTEFDDFVEDGKGIITDFKHPLNRTRYFPKDKWELLAIEDNIYEDVQYNLHLNAKLDIVLKNKETGHIRIIDFKTSTRGWSNNDKEDFTKTSQLILYKAVYSKKYKVPLSKIDVEFIILQRKLYEKGSYAQTRIEVFKPYSYKNDVLQVIREFKAFIEHCFTPEGVHNTNGKFPKVPGKNKKNCKYCPHKKSGKCDGVADPIEDQVV